MGFIEGNIVFIIGLLGILYIGYDLWKSRRDLNKEKAEKSLKGFIEALENANWKGWLIAFFVFVCVFLLARGFILVQNEAQECKVWLNAPLYESLGWESTQQFSDYVFELQGLEQNRSYNYYRRWFDENGGRIGFVNIECNLKLDFERFIKNVRLDYNKGYKE